MPTSTQSPITRKSEVERRVSRSVEVYFSSGVLPCAQSLQREILDDKIRFPLLEFCGKELYRSVSEDDQLPLCNEIEKLKTLGGNVIIGIMLQKRADTRLTESFKSAATYISNANEWRTCDIIGERVFGYALLHFPEQALHKVKKILTDPNPWVIRALGAGFHYAIKKGLGKTDVEILFRIILSFGNARDKEIRQGIGWAAKTTAKFHPELVEKYFAEIKSDATEAWLRTKIKIGLNRNQYARRN